MYYVAKYIGKCLFVPRNVWTVVTKEDDSLEINGVWSLYSEARQWANTLNRAVNKASRYKETLEDSLSNGEPLRPLKNDFMEITDVKN